MIVKTQKKTKKQKPQNKMINNFMGLRRLMKFTKNVDISHASNFFIKINIVHFVLFENVCNSVVELLI